MQFPQEASDDTTMSADIAAFFEDVSTTGEQTPTSDPEINEAIFGVDRLSLKCSEWEERPTLLEHKTLAELPLPKLAGNTRRKPLNLVDLPIDVLKDIVKEVSACRKRFKAERALTVIEGNAY